MSKLTKKHIHNIILVCCYGLLFGLILFFVRRHYPAILHTFAHARWEMLSLLILLHIPVIAGAGLAFQQLSQGLNISLAWKDWMGLSFIANLLNQILPYRPGLLFRYVYLHRHYHMTGADYVLIMLVYLLLTLAVGSCFTLIGWLTSSLPVTLNTITWIALITLVIVCVAISFLKKKPIPLLKNRAFGFSQGTGISSSAVYTTVNEQRRKPCNDGSMQKNIFDFLNHPTALLKSSLTFVFSNLIITLIFYIIFYALNFPLPLSHCFFISGILTLSMIFPVTPGNIGVMETLLGAITQMLYNQFSLGFSAMILFRTTQWIPTFFIGAIFSFSLSGSLFPRLKK